MQKIALFSTSILVALLLFVSAAVPVFAQTSTPPPAGTSNDQPQSEQVWLGQLATALNMSLDDLQTALKGGKTVADLAKDKGLDLNTLVNTLTTPMNTALQKAVQNGKITQALADQRLSMVKTDLNNWFTTGAYPEDFKITTALRQANKTVADALGMSVQDLNAALKGGKTVAQLAQDKGISLDTLVTDITSKRTAALQKSVQDGKMTQDQADAAIKNLKDGITQWLQTGKPPADWKIAAALQDDKVTVAKDLGMTTQELTDAIQGGKTIAQLAQEKGVSLDTLTNDLTASRSAQLQKLVQSGKITQDEANQRLQKLKDAVTKRLQNGRLSGSHFYKGSKTPHPKLFQPTQTAGI